MPAGRRGKSTKVNAMNLLRACARLRRGEDRGAPPALSERCLGTLPGGPGDRGEELGEADRLREVRRVARPERAEPVLAPGVRRERHRGQTAAPTAPLQAELVDEIVAV